MPSRSSGSISDTLSPTTNMTGNIADHHGKISTDRDVGHSHYEESYIFITYKQHVVKCMGASGASVCVCVCVRTSASRTH